MTKSAGIPGPRTAHEVHRAQLSNVTKSPAPDSTARGGGNILLTGSAAFTASRWASVRLASTLPRYAGSFAEE